MARERKFSIEDLYRETKEALLRYGYEGFTFGILAANLDISRGAIYKYYDNKDVLIMNYMVFETEQFLKRLREIDTIQDFENQLDYLLQIILKDTEIHRIREMGIKLPTTEKTKAAKKKISCLHRDMYHILQGFVNKGKSEAKLKQELPNDLILGFLFGTIDLPNHQNTPYSEWIKYIKEIICHGISMKK